MTEPGTVLITGPTRNLGRQAVLAMAGRSEGQRPDLLLVGRVGRDLTAVADEARALGARVREIGCDLASLADVLATAATAATVRDLLTGCCPAAACAGRQRRHHVGRHPAGLA